MAVKVIETTQDVLKYRNHVDESDSIPIYICVPSDIHPHPRYTRPSFEYVYLDGVEYLFGYNHNDLPKPMEIAHKEIITFDLWFDYCDSAFDMSFVLDNKTLVERYTESQRSYHRKFNRLRNINDAIPLKMHLEMLRGIRDDILPISSPSLLEESTVWSWESLGFATGIKQFLTDVEETGVAVDEEQFVSAYGQNATKNIIHGRIHSNFNIHTRTGRPSNAQGGINLAAIPKDGGYRKSFISSYDDGELVEIDFKSFHLYLLLNHLEIKPPTRDIHTWLAKQYFDTDSPTPEQYEESKKITFGQLYGHHKIDSSIEIFSKIQEFRSQLWVDYQLDGVIRTPIGKIPITLEDPTENKVFNYWVQATETEMMFMLSSRISEHIVLYTYDAFLLSVAKFDEIHFKMVAEGYEGFGYPVSIKRGRNYGELATYL